MPTNKQWEADNAADTLVRAEEIRADSKLMASAKRVLTKRQKAIARAAGKPAVKRTPKRTKRTSRRR